MGPFSFLTIQKPSQGDFREKGSKFYAFAFPVTNDSEIKACLQRLKKEYFDASHHCFAWVLGPAGALFRCFDDGEPNHSAGDPILGQIRALNLTNVLVVVVRYFGGTKLGVGGLIQAYRASALEALKGAGQQEVEVKEELVIRFDYDATPEVMRLIKDFEAEISDQQYGETSEIKLAVKLRHLVKVEQRIDLLKATGVHIL